MTHHHFQISAILKIMVCVYGNLYLVRDYMILILGIVYLTE